MQKAWWCHCISLRNEESMLRNNELLSGGYNIGSTQRDAAAFRISKGSKHTKQQQVTRKYGSSSVNTIMTYTRRQQFLLLHSQLSDDKIKDEWQAFNWKGFGRGCGVSEVLPGKPPRGNEENQKIYKRQQVFLPKFEAKSSHTQAYTLKAILSYSVFMTIRFKCLTI